jgi:hypothetical protein
MPSRHASKEWGVLLGISKKVDEGYRCHPCAHSLAECVLGELKMCLR